MEKEISAGFVVVRETLEGPKFLLLYHGGGYWNFPKGKIQAEEGSIQAAFRETLEETGLKSRNLHIERGFKAYEKFTFFKKERKKVFKIVIFYLAKTSEQQISISPREHEGYGWFLYKDAKKIVARHKDTGELLEKAYKFLKQRQEPSNTIKSEETKTDKIHAQGLPDSKKDTKGRDTNI
ncbi:MAG: hypothetical protein A3H06_02465 [Candidatus Colwellbacteria bacterium RIFCSPLOWO2_12_FULL_44_13]|uniref:Nudix hydrolase domain-containing protein n=3 Tax=Candidatus Colwelliibacteriota TaxID=1817904 RepID=A0A1G1Z6I3_9BACT|nr:MAG: hypothetical protein A3F24_03155 [Candidatus Colwellbacteria bacterium RIFCSPHIGHO2_12_FULL_44_17]OGY60243.1 MAG: hypothetical protein A3I31_00685 [Candidatus Colwellbacteria bacterium RIFCSPLOWO2_02_FULL_44_20b]OGY62051.1 MAG: hypothetical protein A3H06_02465 [Candidatus Colwellbacteria bacterium RIFCSPLOWO2_12_FULL_44_13]